MWLRGFVDLIGSGAFGLCCFGGFLFFTKGLKRSKAASLAKPAISFPHSIFLWLTRTLPTLALNDLLCADLELTKSDIVHLSGK